MANLIVRGGSVTQKKHASSIASFALTKLMTNRLSNSLSIKIHIAKGLHQKGEVLGDAIWMDDEPSRRPKEFVVRVDAEIGLRNLCMTIAHEMVHVKQWASGEMYEYNNHLFETSRFNGKQVNRNKIDYWDLPWEIEAHGRELGIFIRWAEECGHSAKKWAHVDY
jgi:hypothetical protein